MIPVAEIEAMDRGALLALWSDLFGGAAPKGMSRTLLRRFLAFEVQARASGGLPKRLRQQLARTGTEPPRPVTPGLAAGGRLLREWNGTTHVVDVVEGGYLWRGTRHRSLSAIARAITGARWSGPRFFGLAADGSAGAGAARQQQAGRPDRSVA